MISNKRILITGGAGFIGASLIGCLMDKNIITVLDTFNRNTLGSMAYKRHPNLKVVHGSVLDPIILEEVVKDQQIIVHCAAIAGIDTVAKQPSDTMRINMIGTANLFEAARHIEGLERVINFSTSEVFGGTAFNSEESDNSNIGAVGEARWTYAVSKLAGEHLAFAYHRQYGLPTVTVRPFNIYGPGQIGEGAMHVFIRKALKNEDLCIFGEGVQIRAWCYIDDMINALKETITNPKALGESFNIGNGRAVITVLGLAQTVCRVLNSKSKIVFRKPLTSDIELRIPSLKKAKKFIGFNAEVDLEEGIQRTAQWYVKHEKALPELPSMFN
jgi:UDP-glucose 4-epimerase